MAVVQKLNYSKGGSVHNLIDELFCAIESWYIKGYYSHGLISEICMLAPFLETVVRKYLLVNKFQNIKIDYLINEKRKVLEILDANGFSISDNLNEQYKFIRDKEFTLLFSIIYE